MHCRIPVRDHRGSAFRGVLRPAATALTLGVCLLALPALSGCAGVDPAALDRILGTGAVDERTIISGLTEALRVGTERTVAQTSQRDGFLGNARIRIPLPSSLDSMAKTLRSVGLGRHVDEFETAMNRAAEQAAAEAAPVFVRAIKSITWADAKAILRGHDTAATEFFQRTTHADLRDRFRPIVVQTMSKLGTVTTYERAADAYDSLPLTETPAFDPYDYVTERSLDGLFTVLGDEERRIREDPAARTTAILRKVFGRD